MIVLMSARTQIWLLGYVLAASVSGAAELAAASLSWEKLPPLPNRGGLGSPYAGVSNGKLLVAGGANFPEAPPWAGGKKLWYDAVYALSEPQGEWKVVGKLMRPMAYGVSATAPAGVICAGGSDLQRHYRDVCLLQLAADRLETKMLPPLPRPMANGCGAMSGNTLYIAGGIEEPNSTNALRTFWALDLAAAAPTWRELEPWPGPARMLAVAAVQDGAFFLISGASLSGDAEGKPVRRYLTDVYCYRPGSGWKQVANLPRPAVAAPSPAPVLKEAGFLVLSGDDGTRVGFQPVQQHPGFAKDILAYQLNTDTWTRMGEVPATQVTVPAVAWRGRYVIPNGEIRPGVRTPEVWSFSLSRAPARPEAAGKL
jgi:N-acetylneuraminic acid mutarotase